MIMYISNVEHTKLRERCPEHIASTSEKVFVKALQLKTVKGKVPVGVAVISDWLMLSLICCLHRAHKARGLFQAVDTSHLVSLPSETAALGETCLATSWCAENGAAVSAGHNSLAVAEHRGDVETSLAFHIHEIAVGGLNQSLQLVL